MRVVDKMLLNLFLKEATFGDLPAKSSHHLVDAKGVNGVSTRVPGLRNPKGNLEPHVRFLLESNGNAKTSKTSKTKKKRKERKANIFRGEFDDGELGVNDLAGKALFRDLFKGTEDDILDFINIARLDPSHANRKKCVSEVTVVASPHGEVGPELGVEKRLVERGTRAINQKRGQDPHGERFEGVRNLVSQEGERHLMVGRQARVIRPTNPDFGGLGKLLQISLIKIRHLLSKVLQGALVNLLEVVLKGKITVGDELGVTRVIEGFMESFEAGVGQVWNGGRITPRHILIGGSREQGLLHPCVEHSVRVTLFVGIERELLGWQKKKAGKENRLTKAPFISLYTTPLKIKGVLGSARKKEGKRKGRRRKGPKSPTSRNFVLQTPSLLAKVQISEVWKEDRIEIHRHEVGVILAILS